MSTLSEIAANHARIALAMEAESARLNALCRPQPELFEAPLFMTPEQMPAHLIAAINESVAAQAAINPS